jgi:hypothetical protein
VYIKAAVLNKNCTHYSRKQNYSPAAGVSLTIFETYIPVAKYTLYDIMSMSWNDALLHAFIIVIPWFCVLRFQKFL